MSKYLLLLFSCLIVNCTKPNKANPVAANQPEPSKYGVLYCESFSLANGADVYATWKFYRETARTTTCNINDNSYCGQCLINPYVQKIGTKFLFTTDMTKKWNIHNSWEQDTANICYYTGKVTYEVSLSGFTTKTGTINLCPNDTLLVWIGF